MPVELYLFATSGPKVADLKRLPRLNEFRLQCRFTTSGLNFRLSTYGNRGFNYANTAILSAVMSSVLELFEETGAYLHGHFRLTSGLHSGEYLQCAKVLAHPGYAEMLGKSLASKVKTLIGDAKLDAIVAPAMGGIIIGHEAARAFATLSLFTERDAVSNEMTLRRGFEIRPDQKVVVIEDVITTGGSTKEVIRLLHSMSANVLAAGSIIDRSGGTADVGVPRASLETLHPVAYKPEECPLCRQGLPVVKPGSRRT